MARVILRLPASAAASTFIIVNGSREKGSKANPLRVMLHDEAFGSGTLLLADHTNIWRKHQFDDQYVFFDRVTKRLAALPSKALAVEVTFESAPAIADARRQKRLVPKVTSPEPTARSIEAVPLRSGGGADEIDEATLLKRIAAFRREVGERAIFDCYAFADYRGDKRDAGGVALCLTSITISH